MARVFIDGFEAGDLKLWDTLTSAPAVATGISGMDGTYCLNLGMDHAVRKNLAAAAEYYFAYRYQAKSLGTYFRQIFFMKGSTVLAYLRRNATTAFIDVYVGGSVVATGTHPINIGTTYLIEVRYKIADSPNGIVQVKVDGVLDIDFAGDTKPGADTTMDVVGLGSDGSSIWAYGYFDNFIVDNAAWPGDTRIQAIVPTGAGASAQWAPSAGANYACVDEVPASEADYNSSNTVGHLDTYAAGDLVGDIASIKCVQVQALAVKEGSPTPLNLQLAVKSGVTTYFSGDQAIPATTSKALAGLWATNPATAAAWEIAAVNAAEIGMKAVA